MIASGLRRADVAPASLTPPGRVVSGGGGVCDIGSAIGGVVRRRNGACGVISGDSRLASVDISGHGDAATGNFTIAKKTLMSDDTKETAVR